MTKMWNSLQDVVVMVTGTDSFKSGFDRFEEDKSISGC